jgi:hypothetical protein
VGTKSQLGEQLVAEARRRTGRGGPRYGRIPTVVGTLAVVAGAVFTALLWAGPASAGTACRVKVDDPYRNSQGRESVSSLAEMDCAGVPGTTMQTLYIEIQEKFGFAWITRAKNTETAASGLHAVQGSAPCQGHGSDQWRAKAIGTDNWGNATTIYTKAVRLGC